MRCETLLTRTEQGVLYLTLNRPEVRNAMNATMVAELSAVFEAIAEDRTVRAVLIHGAGETFCAGGDLKDMRSMLAEPEDGRDPAREMNRAFGRLIQRVDRAPQAVIAVLEGAVLGGGLGLACVSDLALAHRDTQFGLPETGLGIPPAQIAPFVVRRIGLTQARRLAVLGARFDSETALRIGLIHETFSSEEEAAERVRAAISQIRRCAPGANAVTKQLMLDVDHVPLEDLLDRAADEFAASLRGDEGREGTRAFREKRLPRWAVEES